MKKPASRKGMRVFFCPVRTRELPSSMSRRKTDSPQDHQYELASQRPWQAEAAPRLSLLGLVCKKKVEATHNQPTAEHGNT